MSKYEQWKKIQYYTIIGVISLIALFFLPMIGSSAGLAWNLPNTVVGWCVYVLSKLIVAVINILIFHCFIQQAKVNIKDNERFLEAQSILVKAEIEKDIPRGPKEYLHGLYSKKSVSIFITTVLSAVGLTQAVLTFDWMSMLTYFFTILMGLIFGVIQMNETEQYWTEEYWRYAKKTELDLAKAKESAEKAEEDAKGSPDMDYSTDSGTDILDTSVGTGNIGDMESVVADPSGRSNGVLGSTADTSSGTSDCVYMPVEEDTEQA